MKATSKDGTPIAYERSGTGPTLILIDGALCSSGFGPMPKLAPLLARSFTVITYDRRGRGASGDNASDGGAPYAVEREIEDLDALLREAGGAASLLGLSSGGALALHAAAAGLDVAKVIAYEPPYVDQDGQNGGAAHEPRLRELVAAGDRSGAVSYFIGTMVGMPAPIVLMTRLMWWVWPKLVAVAHTLPYDAAVMTQFRVPAERFARIERPALVLYGGKSPARLTDAATAAASAVRGARLDVLAGQTHNVDPAVLAAAAADFLRS
jgi:pimeloyl-ACP methyl ester carboxylesterase